MGDKIEVFKTGTDSLSGRIRDTLEGVLQNPTLNERFGGSGGQLSKAQCGLAAAVVANMQDKLIDEIRMAHAREIGLIGGFWRLYNTRVFARPEKRRKNTEAENKPTLGGLFTWGNMIGAAGICAVALSLWMTNITASYKSSWEHAEQTIARLRAELDSSETANEVLEENLGRANGRVEATETALKAATGNAIEQQKQLLDVIKNLGDKQGELAKQTAGLKSEKTYQNLYKNLLDEEKKLRDRLVELESELKKLKGGNGTST